MIKEGNRKVILKIMGAAVAVFILVYLAITIIGPAEEPGMESNEESGAEFDGELLDDVTKDINVNTVSHPMGQVVVPQDLNDSLT